MDEIRMASLPAPRALTASERELLDFLLTGPVDSPELRSQAAGAMVTRVCSCGCASVGLEVEDDAPRARLEGSVVLPNGGAEIRARGKNRDGLELDVAVHVVGDVLAGEGVLLELEVWPSAASEDGRGFQEPPPLEALRFIG